MTRADIQVIGVSAGAQPFRVAASATRGYAGEPMNFAGSYSSGVSDTNTIVVLTDGKPVIGTDAFVGVSNEDMKVNSSGTVTAHELSVVVPIPNCTRMRGLAKTVANVDTDSELLGVMWDVVLFDLTSSKYTIDTTGSADTSGLTIRGGIPARGQVDVVVDARAMRADVS